MSLTGIAFRNVGRNLFRTVLTLLGVAIAMLAFVLLRTVLSAWTIGAETAAQDRVATRHKVTFVISIPRRYADEIAQIPGVKDVTYFSWFGARVAGKDDVFFANMMADPESLLRVYNEIALPDDQKQAWFEDRQGAIVGAQLARQMGWKVGDKVTLAGTIYPGDWPLTIRGVYTSTSKSVDQSTMYFHWKYVNESPRLIPAFKDHIGWVTSKIEDAGQAANIAAAIDAHFDAYDTQTISMSERALFASFMGMLSALLKTVDILSVMILAIMLLVLGNTIAMGVRERTREYGVMRAIGFRPGHLATLVLGEAAALGLVGGLVGIALSYPLINQGVGQFMEDNFSAFFPYFRLQPRDIAVAIGAAVLGSTLAAALPAWRTAQLNVIDALRRVG